MTPTLLGQINERKQEILTVLSGAVPAADIPRRPAGIAPPLSLAQQRLWLLDQIDPAAATYIMRDAVAWDGALDAELLQQSFVRLLARQAALRTTFAAQDGAPIQVVHSPPENWPIPLTDLTAFDAELQRQELERIGAEEAVRPFDLRADWPIRTRLLRLGPRAHVLVLAMHHIASDGWSMGVLVRELVAHYLALADGTAAALPPLPIDYADFACWQRARAIEGGLTRDVRYWAERLAGAPRLDLPTDRPRAGARPAAGVAVTRHLPRGLGDALGALAQQEAATLFMALLAAVQILLGRYAGQDDICVGTPVAGRQWRETEGLIGFFVNMLVMRADLRGRPSFRAVLRQVRETVLAGFAHQEAPFEQIVETLQPERSLDRTPLFQVAFAVQNAPMAPADHPGLVLSQVELPLQATRFELELHCWPRTDGLRFVAFYDGALFDSATVARLLERLERLLDAVVAQPDLPIDQLHLPASTEPTALAATTELPPIWPRLAARLRADPAALAVIDEGGEYSRAALAAAAAHVAGRLRRLGVGPDVCVGVCLPRSFAMVAAILGVLRAGGAYVPIDPAHPPARIGFMAANCGATVIVTDAANRPVLAGLPDGVRVIEIAAADLAGTSAEPDGWAGEPLPDHLAYVVFTSGTTGRPKGVAIPHRALANYTAWLEGFLPFGPAQRPMLRSSVSFDGAVPFLFGPLLAGAPLVLASHGRDGDAAHLVDQIARHGVTEVMLLPMQLQALLAEPGLARCASLRRIVTGGEAVPADLARRCLERLGATTLNFYGPAEACVNATADTALASDRHATAPIGRPIDGARVYLLDADGAPVPPLMPGELFVGGAGLARGYIGDPAATAARFVPDPYAAEAGARMYRTGDICRMLADGRYEFLRRADDQVKINGVRIEIAEIEQALRRLPEVRDAAALVHSAPDGQKLIAAFVVPNAGEAETQQAPHVEAWRDLYEQTYAEPSGDAASAADFDITGWVSSYTDQPIPAAQMREQVESAVARILALQPSDVLEIGVGTGLLMARIAPHCARYLGTDFSASALAAAGRAVSTSAALAHVRLRQGLADDFSGLAPASLDVVVLNSVAQYFPSADYLLRVIDGAWARLRPGGTLFIGDVRALPLLEAFRASVELVRQPAGTSRDVFARRVRRACADEAELLLAPEFFADLRHRHADVSDTAIELKRGRHANEMNLFRYDVRLRRGDPLPPVPVVTVDWHARLSEVPVLASLFADSPPVLRLRNIPNARLAEARAAMEWVAGRRPEPSLAALRAAVRDGPRPGLDPDRLWEIGERAGYHVRIGFAAADATTCDAVFSLDGQGWPQPDDQATTPRANDPLRRERDRRLGLDLRRRLGEWLPDAMLPHVVLPIDRLPTSANGKLDRAGLLDGLGERRPLGGGRAAQSDTERQLAAIWEAFLCAPRVGADDDFFELGGHSLLAVRIMAQVRDRWAIDLPVRTIFETPSLRGLAARIDALLWATRAAPPASASAAMREEGVL